MKLVDQMIDICREKVESDDFKQEVLNPIVCYIGKQLWPYIAFAIFAYVSIMMLLIFSVYRIQMHVRNNT